MAEQTITDMAAQIYFLQAANTDLVAALEALLRTAHPFVTASVVTTGSDELDWARAVSAAQDTIARAKGAS